MPGRKFIHVHVNECRSDKWFCKSLEWLSRGLWPRLGQIDAGLRRAKKFVNKCSNDKIQSLNLVCVPLKKKSGLPPRIGVSTTGQIEWKYPVNTESDDHENQLAPSCNVELTCVSDGFEAVMDAPSTMQAYVKGAMEVGKKLHDEIAGVVKRKREIDTEWRMKMAKLTVREDVYGESRHMDWHRARINEEYHDKVEEWKEAKRICQRHYECWRVQGQMGTNSGMGIACSCSRDTVDGESDSSSDEDEDDDDADGDDNDGGDSGGGDNDNDGGESGGGGNNGGDNSGGENDGGDNGGGDNDGGDNGGDNNDDGDNGRGDGDNVVGDGAEGGDGGDSGDVGVVSVKVEVPSDDVGECCTGETGELWRKRLHRIWKYHEERAIRPGPNCKCSDCDMIDWVVEERDEESGNAGDNDGQDGEDVGGGEDDDDDDDDDVQIFDGGEGCECGCCDERDAEDDDGDNEGDGGDNGGVEPELLNFWVHFFKELQDRLSEGRSDAADGDN